jgi:hypothetical protein
MGTISAGTWSDILSRDDIDLDGGSELAFANPPVVVA